ncbi:MAG: PD-(D/E)XK nuclease family protein, partial [Verrucomicrobia bacterium]|nr:PD-(D/E)XK nuclease family protein [Verrucomicrobiota bacterium]
QLLGEDGRVMVLRALLLRHEQEFKTFRQSARRRGFAGQLSLLLRQLRQYHVSAAMMGDLANRSTVRPELRGKLSDLAFLHQAYGQWLSENQLQDADSLLDLAADALESRSLAPKFQGLWLDGFAEMTPQELGLLAAIVPHSERATLAFCLAAETDPNDSWLSMWNSVGRTVQQCRQRLESLSDCEVSVEVLPRHPQKSRFGGNPALRRIEAHWQSAREGVLEAPDAGSALNGGVRLCLCANPEAESVCVAREILKFVRAGNRFRDCGVLPRNLETHHRPLARAFRHYGIPFFLDRRESVAHHPLAELSRNALRTVAFDWRHEHWFAALRAGFSGADAIAIDRLENAALEFGWRGGKWREPLPDGDFEPIRKHVFPPFQRLYERFARLNFQPNGRQLAASIREFWDELRVGEILERWSADVSGGQTAIHATVFDQMTAWLENVERGFPGQALAVADWLPILESGLSGLTVGAIPPVLDEVLIGAIDRARNPDLKFAIVPGFNETIFPAPPSAETILTETDREELELCAGPDTRQQLSRERFHGYLACTRASDALLLTFSRRDSDGKILNPSPFVRQLQGLLPALQIEEFHADIPPAQAEHATEIVGPLLQAAAAETGGETTRAEREWAGLLRLPALAALKDELESLREPDPREKLSPRIAQELYGPVLRTSASRLEDFAACPFRFFISGGLRAGERKLFELDARERGSFQHEVLKTFHEKLSGEGRRWRDVTPEEARQRIGGIAEEVMQRFRGGLLRETARTRFAARAMAKSLQDFAAVTVAWLREQNAFDPVAAELEFGTGESPETAWELDLGNDRRLALRGRIDRVDTCSDPGGPGALAIVVDYKSGGKKLDATLLAHGIQLQLPAYLNVLRHWKNPARVFGAEALVPAGVFYVNLRGESESAKSRDEALGQADAARRTMWRHTGRFDAAALPKMDSKGACDQFNYRLTGSGKLHGGSHEAMPRAGFGQLLESVEARLREFGDAIYSGAASVDPYRKGRQTPCEFCDYAAVCRIDPWTHAFRVLRAEKPAGPEE